MDRTSDFEDENKCTPLSRAIEGRNADVVELQLAQGVKVNNDFLLPLHEVVVLLVVVPGAGEC